MEYRFAVPTSESKPLDGLTVAVTREARRAAPFADALRSVGATVVLCPTIETADPADLATRDAALSKIDGYDWLIFTSANGVDRTFDHLLAAGRDGSAFGDARIAAVGPATADAVRARGLRIDVVPGAYVAEALVSALADVGPLAGARVLLARAAVARDVIPIALRDAGASVDVVDVYRTVVATGSADTIRELLANRESLLVTFTSSSTVSNFVVLAGDSNVARVRAACIGPITAAAAREFGFSVVVEAATFTTDGLVDAIIAWSMTLDDGQTGRSA